MAAARPGLTSRLESNPVDDLAEIFPGNAHRDRLFQGAGSSQDSVYPLAKSSFRDRTGKPVRSSTPLEAIRADLPVRGLAFGSRYSEWPYAAFLLPGEASRKGRKRYAPIAR